MKQTNTTTNNVLTTDDGEMINGKYYADVYINDELVLDKIDMEENEIDFDSYISELKTKYSIN